MMLALSIFLAFACFAPLTTEEKQMVRDDIASLSPKAAHFGLRIAVQNYLDDKKLSNHPICEFAMREGKKDIKDTHYDVANHIAIHRRPEAYEMMYQDIEQKLQQMKNHINGSCITQDVFDNLKRHNPKPCGMAPDLGNGFITNLIDHLESKFFEVLNPSKELKDGHQIAKLKLHDHSYFVVRLKLNQSIKEGLLALSHDTVIGFVGTFENQQQEPLPIELKATLTTAFNVETLQMVLTWEACFGLTSKFEHEDDVKIEGPQLALKIENGRKAFVGKDNPVAIEKREVGFTLCKGTFWDSICKIEAKIPIGKYLKFDKEDFQKRKYEIKPKDSHCSLDLGAGELKIEFEIKMVTIATTFNIKTFLKNVFDWDVCIPKSIMDAIQETIEFMKDCTLTAIMNKIIGHLIPDNLFGNIDLVEIMMLGENIGKLIKSAFNKMKEVIERAILGIVKIFEFFKKIWDKVEKFVTDAANETKEWFEKDFVDFWKNDARTFFEDNPVTEFIREDVNEFFEDTANAVENAANVAVDGVRSLIGV